MKPDYPSRWLNLKIAEGIVCVKIPKRGVKDVEKYADNYLGRGYAWFDMFGITLSFLLSWKMFTITGAKRLICSEAVARILYDASNKNLNLEKEFGKPCDFITPMDLFNSAQLE